MAKIPLEPYKGVRDFYPDDMFVQNYIFEAMRRVCEQFGYVEYTASPLEPTELYREKSSEEIVNEQTYTFEDRGGRSVTLRPEMTPTVARMVAARRRDLAFPLRWYSIGNMFRYERPQRGRFREHWQLNADIFGPDAASADVEVVLLAVEILRELGASDNDFAIRINNRAALEELVGEYTDDADTQAALIRLIDKKDKIDDFDEQFEKLAGQPLVIPESEDDRVAAVRAQLAALGVENAVWDPLLARGFDYYTGITFEFFDTNADNPRSLLGGGRYDKLLGQFAGEDIPAAGFGMGDVTIRDFLETHNLLPTYVPPTDLYICTLAPNFVPAAQQLAQRLRAQDIASAVHLSERKVADQIKTATKHAIPFMLCVGENEVASGSYELKNLTTGDVTTVAEDQIAETIWSQGV